MYVRYTGEEENKITKIIDGEFIKGIIVQELFFSVVLSSLTENMRSSSLFATEGRDRDGEMVGVEVVFVKTWNLRYDRIIIERRKVFSDLV